MARFGAAFPWGTLVVNVVGSFVLGVVVGAGLGTAPLSLIGIGFCGAFTTFSTMATELALLWRDGDRTLAAFLRMPRPLYRKVFGTEWYRLRP